MADPIYLGVEGGGSKSRAIVEWRGQVSAKIQWDGLNPHDLGIREFEARLRSLVGPLVGPLVSRPKTRPIPIYAYFALAGAGKPALRRACRKAIARVLSRYATRRSIRVATDVAALGERYLRNRQGIVLIAGTGSICVAVGRSGGRRHSVRVGGKGGSLDKGSGYAIGSRLVEHLLSLPQRSRRTKRYGVSVAALRAVAACGCRSRVASLAPLVLAGYRRGDRFAQSVAEEAVSDLVRMVLSAAERAGIPERSTIYLAGGLFMNVDFEKLFRLRLRRVLPGLSPRLAVGELSALLALAKQLVRPTGASLR